MNFFLYYHNRKKRDMAVVHAHVAISRDSTLQSCSLLSLTRPNVLVCGSLNGLLGEICGAATEYCLISCFVCMSASTAAHEAALL